MPPLFLNQPMRQPGVARTVALVVAALLIPPFGIGWALLGPAWRRGLRDGQTPGGYVALVGVVVAGLAAWAAFGVWLVTAGMGLIPGLSAFY